MASLERIIKRADGSEVKLVARAFFGVNMKIATDVDVFRRSGPDDDWKLTSAEPHPDWRKMSVDEYNKRGRSERFQTASHGEIFKVGNDLRASLQA